MTVLKTIAAYIAILLLVHLFCWATGRPYETDMAALAVATIALLRTFEDRS